jgi:hypothetical protein
VAITAARRSPAQTFALVFGVVYLAVGVLGLFFAEEFTGGRADDELIIFRINHLHNIIHIALGVVWIGASRTLAAARGVNLLFGVVLVLLAVLGFAELDFMHDLFNIVDTGDPDNWLHLVSGILAIYFGTAGASARTSPTPAA